MKVLIIDDEKSIREVLELSLEDDWMVLVAASGDEGLAIARREKPDLILLDRMMPGKDGIATLKELRADPEIGAVPVIFLTARVQTQHLGEYEGLDVLGVLSKPFDPMTLTDEIGALLAGRRTN
ncbi:MAG: response regulator [Candidatus Melainabacteria bacterium]|nr:response regulator [Candidatus Melainabacteria bacterium]